MIFHAGFGVGSMIAPVLVSWDIEEHNSFHYSCVRLSLLPLVCTAVLVCAGVLSNQDTLDPTHLSLSARCSLCLREPGAPSGALGVNRRSHESPVNVEDLFLLSLSQRPLLVATRCFEPSVG